MQLLKLYREYLDKDTTKYFIVDSGQHLNDQDFKQYTWDKSINNKISENDIFIYRKPQKVSNNGKFYLYGVGVFGPIVGDRIVTSKIYYPQQFNTPIFQDELLSFQWDMKVRGDNWEHFWNQYGINEITKNDFYKLLSLQNDDYNFDEGILVAKAFGDIANGNYFVEDSIAVAKHRPEQSAWSKSIKSNYGYRCAVCSLTTPDLLIGSHIIPWKDDKQNRINPSNGICLCVLHDKAFDKGIFTLSDDMKIILAKDIKDAVLLTYLKPYEGKKIKLPSVHLPGNEFIRYHRASIFNR